MKKITIILLFSLFLCLPNLWAQEEEKKAKELKLEEIVVTATRSPRAVKDVPSSTTVIDAKDIELSGEETIDEVLRDEVGVFVVRPSGIVSHSDSTLTLRGMTWGRTLIMIDGTPLNEPYAQNAVVDIIPKESIGRVEVVRGATSALYGTNAIGGAINIITKEPEEKFTIKGTSGYGNMKTWESFIEMSGKKDRFGLLLSGGRLHTEGYMPYTDEYVKKFMIGYYNITPIDKEMGRSKFYGKVTYDLSEDQKLIFSTLLNRDDIDGPAKNKESSIYNVRWIFGWEGAKDRLSWDVKGYVNVEDMSYNRTTSAYGVKDQVEYVTDGDFNFGGFISSLSFSITPWWKFISGFEYKDGKGGWKYEYFLVDRDHWIKGKQRIVSGFFSNDRLCENS